MLVPRLIMVAHAFNVWEDKDIAANVFSKMDKCVSSQYADYMKNQQNEIKVFTEDFVMDYLFDYADFVYDNVKESSKTNKEIVGEPLEIVRERLKMLYYYSHQEFYNSFEIMNQLDYFWKLNSTIKP